MLLFLSIFGFCSFAFSQVEFHNQLEEHVEEEIISADVYDDEMPPQISQKPQKFVDNEKAEIVPVDGNHYWWFNNNNCYHNVIILLRLKVVKIFGSKYILKK